MVRFWLVLMMCCACEAMAEDAAWRTSWDGTLYGYRTHAVLRDDSVLNPGNQFAQLAQRRDTAEARLNFKAERDELRIAMRPILVVQNGYTASDVVHRDERYLSQGQVRWRFAEVWQVSAGREVLNWGAAQFRSPASPFYFDNGRSDPMRELSGVDAVRVSWTPDVHTSAYLARVTGSGHVAVDAYRDTWLLKADLRGDEGAIGAVLSRKDGQEAFVGMHAQQTLGDAWLLYGEAASYVRYTILQSPADSTQPFTLGDSPRGSDALLGVNYTFDDGRSLAAEYLYYGHGYGKDAASAYFARVLAANASGAWQTTALALSAMPPLLNRNYLHVVWQNNLMDSSSDYWRLMWSHNLDDHGSEMALYGEMNLDGRISAYTLALLPLGNAQQEFSSLLGRMVTVGAKLALP